MEPHPDSGHAERNGRGNLRDNQTPQPTHEPVFHRRMIKPLEDPLANVHCFEAKL